MMLLCWVSCKDRQTASNNNTNQTICAAQAAQDYMNHIQILSAFQESSSGQRLGNQLY